MRIAITGGSGFIGKPLIRALCDIGHHVCALEHQSPVAPYKNLTVVSGSLNDDPALAEFLAGADVCVHLAGLVAARTENDFFKINTQATERLMTAAQNAKVKRFLYVSSLAAREPHLSAYAQSKRDAEDIVLKHSDIPTDVIRPAAVYGPADTQTFKIFESVQKGLAVLPGQGNGRVSVIHVDDLVQAIVIWLEMVNAPQGDVFELGDGVTNGYSWHDIMKQAAKALGKEPRYIKMPAPVMKAMAGLCSFYAGLTGQTPYVSPDKVREMFHEDWCANPAAFMEKTGWAPRIKMRDGLGQTIKWYQDEGWL